MKLYLLTAVVILITCAGCGAPSHDEAMSADSLVIDGPIAASESQNVHVVDLEYARLPTGRRIVSGQFVNPTDRPVRTAQVQISLYDEDNRAIDRMLVVVQNIGAQGAQPFRQTVDNERAVGARVRGIMAR